MWEIIARWGSKSDRNMNIVVGGIIVSAAVTVYLIFMTCVLIVWR